MSVKSILPVLHWRWNNLWAIIAVFLLLLYPLAGQPATAEAAVAAQAVTIIRVSADGAGSGTCGADWGNPCSLQYALQQVAPAHLPAEIWVKAGTYSPGPARENAFQLANNIAVYGGFVGSETLRTQRLPKTYVSTLSGAEGNNYQVVVDKTMGDAAILDGFTISGGNANGSSSPYTYGGGIYLNNSRPTLANLTITNNYGNEGGGLYANGSQYRLTRSTLVRNRANSGAGIYHAGSSTPKLIDVTFYGNVARDNGGAMYNTSSSAPDLSNTIMAGNQALSAGGVFSTNNSAPVLRNATIVGNEGGAFYTYGTVSPNNATIVNSIIWSNGSPSFYINGSLPYIKRSLLEGGCPFSAFCQYVLSSNPQFLELPAPGADNQWGTGDDDYGDLHPASTSPVVDAGDNGDVLAEVTTDLAGGPRFIDNPKVRDTGAGTPPLVDFGAYELGMIASETSIISSLPDNSIVGQVVVVAFEVKSATGSGTPTGDVTITGTSTSGGTNETQTCTADATQKSCNLIFTSAGTKSLTASYAGDTQFLSSQSAAQTHTVDQAGTQVQLTFSPEPSLIGEDVIANFTVVPVGAGQPTGQVLVQTNDAAHYLLCSNLNVVGSGSCKLDLTYLPAAGNYYIVASYSGDSNFKPSTSPPDVYHTVANSIYTTIKIDSVTPASGLIGQATLFHFQVTAAVQGHGTPAGTVTVSDGTDQCQATLSSSGQGQCSVTFSTAGEHAMVASYTPSSGSPFSASETTYAYQVNRFKTSISLVITPSRPTLVGEEIQVQYTLQYQSAGSYKPTGNVVISNGVTTWTLDAATQTMFKTTPDTLGQYTWTAAYAGDNIFQPSTSAGVIHGVHTLTFLPVISR